MSVYRDKVDCKPEDVLNERRRITFIFLPRHVDTISGIPTFGTTQYSGQVLTTNYNKMIHSNLFPNSMEVSRSSLNVTPKPVDRLLRYERSLNNQYRKEFDMDMSADESKNYKNKSIGYNIPGSW